MIHLALMGSMYLLLSILLPSIFFWILEPDWTFLDGLYFVFISLTTIGLGDYIPGDNPHMTEFQVYIYRVDKKKFSKLHRNIFCSPPGTFVVFPMFNVFKTNLQTVYKSCVGLYLLFGLVLTSLTLTVFYDIPQLNLGLHLHRHRSR